MRLKQLIFLLWPPYELYVTHKEIDKKYKAMGENTELDLIEKEIRESLSKEDQASCKQLQSMAERVQDAELGRKEILDSKASTFASSIGIITGIVSMLPVLFGDKGVIPLKWAITAGLSYLLAVIHLFIAIYYAIQARRIVGFARPCVDTFVESIKNSKISIQEQIILMVTQTKWNEKSLLKKSNHLSVVEDLFLRGLAFLTLASVIVIAVKLVTLAVE